MFHNALFYNTTSKQNMTSKNTGRTGLKKSKKKRTRRDPERPTEDIEVSVKFGNEIITVLPKIGDTPTPDNAKKVGQKEVESELVHNKPNLRSLSNA